MTVTYAADPARFFSARSSKRGLYRTTPWFPQADGIQIWSVQGFAPRKEFHCSCESHTQSLPRALPRKALDRT